MSFRRLNDDTILKALTRTHPTPADGFEGAVCIECLILSDGKVQGSGSDIRHVRGSLTWISPFH